MGRSLDEALKEPATGKRKRSTEDAFDAAAAAAASTVAPALARGTRVQIYWTDHSPFGRYMKAQLRLAGGRRKPGRHRFSSDTRGCLALPYICATCATQRSEIGDRREAAVADATQASAA